MQNAAPYNPIQDTSPSSDACNIQAPQLNQDYGFKNIIGQSNKMMEMLDNIEYLSHRVEEQLSDIFQTAESVAKSPSNYLSRFDCPIFR